MMINQLDVSSDKRFPSFSAPTDRSRYLG